MRLAIVHYHLHPGGVTRIIQSALAALQVGDPQSDVQAVVLSGEPPEQADTEAGGYQWPVPVRVVDGLGYEERRAPRDAAELQQDLLQAATDALGGPPDLWHIHNHSLGKNLAMPGVVSRLAADGHRLLLQMHDFAEDGRPQLYRRQQQHLNHEPGGQALLYPAAPGIHYALLNGRDHATVSAAGDQPERVHALPNPVVMASSESSAETSTAPTDNEQQLWLYPTRAIRRKNLGELLLWSAVAEPHQRFAATLAPRNPTEIPGYQRWKAIAAELQLPMEFELASRPRADFEQLVASSHALVTTSVAEGFGMAFLEPWLAGRPVCGRDLPAITHEFSATGIRLDKLYPRLDIPLDWVDADSLQDKAREGLQRVMGAYGQDPDASDLERCLQAWTNDDHIDFGRLDEDLQQGVIRRLSASPSERAALRPNGLKLPEDGDDTITHNRDIIAREYSLQRYGQQLMAIYQALLEEPHTGDGVAGRLDAGAILDRFLAPENLYLLRS